MPHNLQGFGGVGGGLPFSSFAPGVVRLFRSRFPPSSGGGRRPAEHIYGHRHHPLGANGRTRPGPVPGKSVRLKLNGSAFCLLVPFCVFVFQVTPSWWFGLVLWGFKPLVLLEGKWEPPPRTTTPPIQTREAECWLKRKSIK